MENNYEKFDLIKFIENSSSAGSEEEAAALENQANETAAKANELAYEIAQIKGEPVGEYVSKIEIAVAEAMLENYAKEAAAAAENAATAGTAEEAEKYAKQAQEAAEHAKAIGTQFGDNITENANKLISEAQQSAEAAVNVSEEKKAFEEASRQADTGLSYTKEEIDDKHYIQSITIIPGTTDASIRYYINDDKFCKQN